MINRGWLRVIVVSLFTAIYSIAVSNTCPSFTKKDIAVLGNRSDVPEGWFIYAPGNTHGIYKSPLSQYDPARIDNTGNDAVKCLDISPDGEWIVYLRSASNGGFIYIMKPDGSQRTTVPVRGVGNGFPRGTGFYHNSPKGTEILYSASWQVLRAVEVDLSSSPPQFGDHRTVIDFSDDQGSPQFHTYGWQETIRVNGSHFFSQLVTSGEVYKLVFVTIPNNGQGIATMDNAWRFTDMPDTSIYGCGIALSFEGDRALWNPGSQGDRNCVPNRESGMDHKGFVVAPFMEKDDPQVGIHEIIDEHAISVNWAPPQYRYGSPSQVDFTGWSFTNNGRYVSGILWGEQTNDRGVWLVDWGSNTWTHLTGNMNVECAAVHFGQSQPYSVKNPLRFNPLRTAGEYNRTTLYTISGRRIRKSSLTQKSIAGPGVYIIRNKNYNTKAVYVR
ncbi:MAG: hypothetical protein GF401_01340 [Chitinivibrionales bacterium]|nr:hypothetical protein [Chitinivibrionales bacterium]